MLHPPIPDDLLHPPTPSDIWTPTTMHLPHVEAAAGAPAQTASYSYDEHKARTPPPDLPSLLLDSRIIYLGMPVGPQTRQDFTLQQLTKRAARRLC